MLYARPLLPEVVGVGSPFLERFNQLDECPPAGKKRNVKLVPVLLNVVQLEAEMLCKALHRALEVAYDNAQVVHAFDLHRPSSTMTRVGPPFSPISFKGN